VELIASRPNLGRERAALLTRIVAREWVGSAKFATMVARYGRKRNAHSMEVSLRFRHAANGFDESAGRAPDQKEKGGRSRPFLDFKGST